MFAALLRFAITAAAIPVCSRFMDGVVVLDQHNALIVGVILAIIFTLIRPLMRLLLSILNFCTLGLLFVALDAWLVGAAASFVDNSVYFQSFWWALAVAVAVNAARTLVDILAGDLRR